MKKKEFAALDYRVSLYKEMSSSHEKFLRLKEFLQDVDLDSLHLSVSGKSFRGEDFDILPHKLFREALVYLCDTQIVSLEEGMEDL